MTKSLLSQYILLPLLTVRAVNILMIDKREQLIEIATQLFSERGYENTPLSLICEKANVSKGLISHHFKSKDGLLREIFIRTTHLMVEMNDNPDQNDNPKKRLSHLLESFFTQLQANKSLFQFNLNMIAQPNTREILDDLIKQRSSFLIDATKSIFNQLDPENSLIKSYMFVAELDGIALSYMGIFDDYPLQLMKEHMIEKYT